MSCPAVRVFGRPRTELSVTDSDRVLTAYAAEREQTLRSAEEAFTFQDHGHVRIAGKSITVRGKVTAFRLRAAGVEKIILNGKEVAVRRGGDFVLLGAAALHRGPPEALSYYLGKVLECASFYAEPYGGKETVLGEIVEGGVHVTAMHPTQRCTVASVAGHAMYERSNPHYEYFAGGVLDMSQCRYEQITEKTTRVTGPRFEPAGRIRVKLEGAAKIGERYVGIAGVRDPYTIAHIDAVIDWARQQVRERFGTTGYELHYTVYGRNGVMGVLEPVRTLAHELGLVVQGIAPTKEMAEEVCMTGTRQLFYARLPDVKGTAGSVAFVLDEVMPASTAYRWSIHHTVAVDQPLELFPLHMTEAGV